MIAIAWIAFGCAALPALLYLWNSFLFREPPSLAGSAATQRDAHESRAPFQVAAKQISVLIPARNEERGIAACVEAVLASRDVELEVIVLDDHSTDRTAEIVRGIAARDARVRVELAPPLPDGWCGKQAACFALAKLAKYETISFLDADVRLEPDALARMALFLERSGAALVSGFPRQETETSLEKLLIPLIHWLMLCWLPLWAMRRFRWAAFGAGCGQWFMTTRTAYELVGGHEAVKSSLHDGLTLPRAYRRAGFMTDICDASKIATCRMYRSGREVWFGLAKNAREGLASSGQIGFWTVVLLFGQVLPFMAIIPFAIWFAPEAGRVLGATLALAWAPKLAAHRRWSPNAVMEAFSHPLSIFLLLAIQWYAIFLALIGRPVGWKGRAHPAGVHS